MIDRKIVATLLAQMGTDDIGELSIREIGKLVAMIEQKTELPFIHMEMGVPGLPPSQIGIDAEKQALEEGIAQYYPHIEGIPIVKNEIARFVKNFLDLPLSPLNCLPTVGAMQASFAALYGVSKAQSTKTHTLFIDPGFPVQKSQLQLFGLPYKTFDIKAYRGEKLRQKLETYLKQGDVCSICYSSPNNPTWICLTQQELQIIGELAEKYDVIVVEDLAYLAMDFRIDYGVSGKAPFQPTVAHYTDNYMLIMSASKTFSYAGQRIGMLILSEKIRTRSYPHLRNYFTADTLGHFIPYGVLYATTAGTSHTAQYALAKMLQAVNDGKEPLLEKLHIYGEKAKKMKKAFLDNGFYLVYEDDKEALADGFYFTIAYPYLSSSQLLYELLHYGISAISLQITGSEDTNGLRACVSFVSMEQIPILAERLRNFHQSQVEKKKCLS